MEIWKYVFVTPGIDAPPLVVTTCELDMPKFSTIISIQASIHNEQIQMWAKVNPEEEHETREFVILGTGQEFNEDEDGLVYLGTVQSRFYVWHVFERTG